MKPPTELTRPRPVRLAVFLALAEMRRRARDA